MLPVRNTLQLPPPPPSSPARLGPGIRAYLSFAKGGVGSAPATIINGVAALGCGAQYRRLLAVRRTSIVPPCQSFLLPLPTPRPSFSRPPSRSSPTPLSLHYFRGYRRATLCPSFFHLDAAGWNSARRLRKRDWSTREPFFARFRFLYSFLPRCRRSRCPTLHIDDFDVNSKRCYSNFNL